MSLGVILCGDLNRQRTVGFVDGHSVCLSLLDQLTHHVSCGDSHSIVGSGEPLIGYGVGGDNVIFWVREGLLRSGVHGFWVPTLQAVSSSASVTTSCRTCIWITS